MKEITAPTGSARKRLEHRPSLLTYHMAQTNRTTVHVPRQPSRLMRSPLFTLFLLVVLVAVLWWALNA